MKTQPNLQDIYALFTKNPVLLPLIPGTKIINDKGWNEITWEQTQSPNYQARLRATPNVGILLGKNSGNLLFFDWDTQAALDWFLENNFQFKNSFRVTGRGVGGQVGGYCEGEYPDNAVFKVNQDHPLAAGGKVAKDGTVQVGSLRGDRLQSVLCGNHPDTHKPYSWPNDAPPIAFVFKDIKWHPDFVLPWEKNAEHQGNGKDDPGSPLKEATRGITIDFLWKHFGFPKRSKNPSSSPFRDDNSLEHHSFSIWTDKESGKQVFKDFHDNYAHHKGDSYNFFKLATHAKEEEGKETFRAFWRLYEQIRDGETPPPHQALPVEPELYIPPVRETFKVTPIAEAAYTGFLGEWVRYVEPLTECNRDNLLLQAATVTGIVLGRYFYTYAGQDLFPNLFTVILGPTGARKGTALVPVSKFYALAAPEWRGAQGGWKSGEALIHGIRDPRQTGKKSFDEGVADKRLLVEETELIHLFKTAGWEGNTLLATLRDFWDSKEIMATRAVKSPARASYGHVGMIGHMTGEEFLLVDPDLITDGVINRITWGNAFRARLLPNSQPIEWPQNLVDWFKDIYAYAYRPQSDIDIKDLDKRPEVYHIPLDANAKFLWEKVYLQPEETGTLALVFKRWLSQALKFALVYAICAKSLVITGPHFEAGLAIAEHSRANARRIFQGFGPNKIANKLFFALKRNPEGLSQDRINRHVFNGKVSGDEIHEAIQLLVHNGLISTYGRSGVSRSVIWRAI